MPQYEDYWPLEEPEEESEYEALLDGDPYLHPPRSCQQNKARYDSEYNYIGEEPESDYD